MSMSILYSVASKGKLTNQAAEKIQYILDYNHNKHGTLDNIRFTPDPLEVAGKKDWEMHGSTELPANLDDAWHDIRINCSVLTLCRRELPDATWTSMSMGTRFSGLKKNGCSTRPFKRDSAYTTVGLFLF